MTRPSIRWRMLPLVCAGGTIGVAARYALSASADGAGEIGVIWATLAINLLGALLLGVVVGALGDRHPRWRAFLGTGALGGFTTYSAFAVELGGFAAVMASSAASAPVGALLGILAPFGLGLGVLLAAGVAALLGLAAGEGISRAVRRRRGEGG